ncbi:hypothetical protein [Orenia marismortui]|nr:hypothetical protein [Orenia marismortui]
MKVIGCYRDEKGEIKELDEERMKKIAKKLLEIQAKAIGYEIAWTG